MSCSIVCRQQTLPSKCLQSRAWGFMEVAEVYASCGVVGLACDAAYADAEAVVATALPLRVRFNGTLMLKLMTHRFGCYATFRWRYKLGARYARS